MPKYGLDAREQGFSDLTPETYARVQREQGPDAWRYPDTPGIKWWEPVLALGGVAGAGALGLGGATGFGAGSGAGAAAGGGIPVTAGGSLPSLLGAGGTSAGTGSLAGGTVAGTSAGGGWLSTLGKAVGVPSGSGAAGWTGALVDRIPQIAELARAASGASSGRAAGRLAEANAAHDYDILALARNSAERDRARAELEQRKFAQDLQERSYKTAGRAALLQNARPGPVVAPPPEMARFMGTPARSLGDIPQSTRDELGGAMYRNAITELLDPLQPGTATSGRRMAALPAPDPLSETPDANWIDSALNTTSTVGGLLPSIVDLIRGPEKPPASTPGATGLSLSPRSTSFGGGTSSPASTAARLFPSTRLPSISEATVPDVVAPNVGMFSGRGRTGIQLNNDPSRLFAPPPPTPTPTPYQDPWRFLQRP